MTISLSAKDFKDDGYPTDELIGKIESLDPDWVNGAGTGPNQPPLLDPKTYRELDKDKVLGTVFKGY